MVDGSCLCGDVAYEITGEPVRMAYCYCSRCRRARSSAHCANIFYPLDAVRFTRGAAQVIDYQYPEARYFGTAFCRRCGAMVARLSRARGVAVVPAGSLDTDPGIRPMMQVFVDSKASWIDITDTTTPRFAEMPPAHSPAVAPAARH